MIPSQEPYRDQDAYRTVMCAIADSRRQDRIVTLDADEDEAAALCDELSILADDSAENGRITEHWGRDWRVHVEAKETP